MSVKKKIMLVDDKSTIAKIISIYLSSEYDFDYYENPLTAIEALEAGNHPDLIITDIRMPKMMGDQFLKWLKDNDRFKQIPVVILSGEDSSSERVRLLQNGANDYIVKPFNPMELQVRIRKILS